MPHKTNPLTGKQIRGFSGMSLERRTEISKLGGGAGAAHNRSFAKDRELAKRAGSAGGHAAAKANRDAANDTGS